MMEAAHSNTALVHNKTDMEMTMEAVVHQRHLDLQSTQHILATTHNLATPALTIMEAETIPTAAEAVETIRMVEAAAAKEAQWTGDRYKVHGETFDFSSLPTILSHFAAHYRFIWKYFLAAGRFVPLPVRHLLHFSCISTLWRLRCTHWEQYLFYPLMHSDGVLDL
jgi:hypothetical protein